MKENRNTHTQNVIFKAKSFFQYENEQKKR